MSFDEKAYWENRTAIYLEETKNLHKWSDDKKSMNEEKLKRMVASLEFFIGEVEQELEKAQKVAQNLQDELFCLKVECNQLKDKLKLKC